MKIPSEKKQNEVLYDTAGFMAAESEVVGKIASKR